MPLVAHAGEVAVRAEVDVFDGRVLRRSVHGLHGIPDADDVGAGSAAGEQGRGVHPAQRVGVLRLLAQGDLGQVDAEHAGLGQDSLAAAGGRSRADEAHHEDETDDVDQKEAADDGQDHFDKIFHDEKRKYLTKVGKFAK